VANTGITIEGLVECLAAFKQLDAELRKEASGELRAASKQIAAGIVPMLGGSGAPQESAVLEAAGPKSDRFVAVAVPNRKPSLSGLRKTPAAAAKRIGFALEGGSDKPQFHRPAAGSLVASHKPQMAAYAVPRYQAALAAIMRKYGLL
jgi:hypothetical protein